MRYALLLAALLPAGCVPAGLLNMDDGWCAKHPSAGRLQWGGTR